MGKCLYFSLRGAKKPLKNGNGEYLYRRKQILTELVKEEFFLSGDLHCYTRLSNGSLGIDDLIALAKISTSVPSKEFLRASAISSGV